MKKILVLLLSLTMLFGFVACDDSNSAQGGSETTEATEDQTRLAATVNTTVFSDYFLDFIQGGDINVNEANNNGGITGTLKLDEHIDTSTYIGDVDVDANLNYQAHDITVSGPLHVANQTPDCSDLTIYIDGARVSGEAVNDMISI